MADQKQGFASQIPYKEIFVEIEISKCSRHSYKVDICFQEMLLCTDPLIKNAKKTTKDKEMEERPDLPRCSCVQTDYRLQSKHGGSKSKASHHKYLTKKPL
jgi:hypothetical protein